MVAYDRPERFAGETKFSFRKMLVFAIGGITSFTFLPLRFAFFLGAALIGFAVLMGLWAVVGWMRGVALAAWTPLTVSLYLLSGIQLMFLGRGRRVRGQGFSGGEGQAAVYCR